MCPSYTATLVRGRGCRRQPGRAPSKPARNLLQILPVDARRLEALHRDFRHASAACLLRGAHEASHLEVGIRHVRHGFRGAIVQALQALQGAWGSAIRTRVEVAARIARYIYIERVHGPAD
jgi:hypothetical protein